MTTPYYASLIPNEQNSPTLLRDTHRKPNAHIEYKAPYCFPILHIEFKREPDQHHFLADKVYDYAMWTVYLIQHSVTFEIYIGVTSDFKRRIADHNDGNTASTHRKCGKWTPIYLEIFRSKEDAYTRERRLKHHGRAKQELLRRIENSLNKR